MEAVGLKGRITDAIRYWEPRRLAYNAVLFVVVLFYFVKDYPASKQALSLDEILVVFVLTVLANVAYCAAYVPMCSPKRQGCLKAGGGIVGSFSRSA
jgi:hypothetical protein